MFRWMTYLLLAVAAVAGLWQFLPIGPAPRPLQGGEPAAEEDQNQAPNQADAQIERGEYLALHVAMCVQCHTPHDEVDGSLKRRQLFQGGPMPVASPFPRQRWSASTPKIAGLPGGRSEADLVELLTTGHWPDGTSPLPPMPPFRMNKQDAAAVAAYLKSLR